jgi:hypothetical protein
MIMANVNINGKNPLLLDNTKTIRTKAYLKYFRYTVLLSHDNVHGPEMLVCNL